MWHPRLPDLIKMCWRKIWIFKIECKM